MHMTASVVRVCHIQVLILSLTVSCYWLVKRHCCGSSLVYIATDWRHLLQNDNRTRAMYSFRENYLSYISFCFFETESNGYHPQPPEN